MAAAKNYNSSETNMMRLRMLEKTVAVLRANPDGMTVDQMTSEVHKAKTCTRQYLQDLLAGGIVKQIKQRVGRHSIVLLHVVVGSESQFQDFLTAQQYHSKTSKKTMAKTIVARLAVDENRHVHMAADDEPVKVTGQHVKPFYDAYHLPRDFFRPVAA